MVNIEIVAFLPEDCGTTYTTRVMHRTSMASLEYIKINFRSIVMHWTTIPMTEIFSFFFFNRILKHYLKSINQCLRCLLVDKNKGNSDRNFVYGKVISMLGILMVKESFEKFFCIEIE